MSICSAIKQACRCSSWRKKYVNLNQINEHVAESEQKFSPIHDDTYVKVNNKAQTQMLRVCMYSFFFFFIF